MTKIYHVVNSSTAIENLRSDLHNLVAWSNEWQMLFNIEKRKITITTVDDVAKLQGAINLIK